MSYRSPADALEAKLSELVDARRALDGEIARVQLELEVHRAARVRRVAALASPFALGCALLGAVGVAVVAATMALWPRGPHGPNARTDASTIRGAVEMFVAERSGACPTLGELVVGGYLNGSTPTSDPWGQPFHIDCGEPGSFAIEVTSSGPDRQLGTEDDLR